MTEKKPATIVIQAPRPSIARDVFVGVLVALVTLELMKHRR